MKKVFFLLSLLVVGVVVGIWKKTPSVPSNQAKTTQETQIAAIQEQVPAAQLYLDLTIPALRQRSYSSQIEVGEEWQKTPNYTAYLASYTSDGLKVNGLLTKPSGPEPEGGWPAVVFLHGYIPPDQYVTTQKYGEYVNYLARSGFVVFKIDYRGHGESEGDPTGAYYGADYVADTLNAYEGLKTLEFVNPDQIGLWGHSMSGNVLMRSLAVRPDIKAGVIWAGAVYSYTDFLKYRLNDNSFDRNRPLPSNFVRRSAQLTEAVGPISAENPFWQAMAPTTYLKDFETAIQLHHAVDDTVVNIGYSRDLDQLLTTAGVDHQLYEYSNGGHNLTGASFSQAMRRTVEWYNEKLLVGQATTE